MKINNKTFTLAMIAIILISIMTAFFFGMKKQGFYIDEYYSYTRANGTGIGISIVPGEWNDTSPYIEELVSSGEELFNFKGTYNNCGFHPPVYHYMLHFASSLVPGVFSKWIGVGLNMVLLVIMLLLSAYIADRLSKGNRLLVLLSTLAVGIAPCIITGVVFVRMYLALTVFALWYMAIHLNALEWDMKEKKITDKSVILFALQIIICGFSGFLTMYYFVIIAFFISFFFAVYRFFVLKDYKNTVIYGVVAIIPYVLSYFYFPSCIYFIFKGNKGKKVTGNLLKSDDIFDRLGFFYNMLNRHVFGGLLPLFMLLLFVGIIAIVIYLKKGGKLSELPKDIRYIIMAAGPAVLYFLLMLKITVKTGDTTNRYCLPVYPLFLILMVVGGCRVLNRYKKISKYPIAVTAVLVAIAIMAGYATGQVMYLYPEQARDVEYARANPDSKVVMFQRDDGQYDSQIQWLMMYDKVYYISCGDLETAKDDTLANADELLVYIDKKADKDECFNSLYEQNEKLSAAELLWECPLSFDAYLLH